jgi:hypothetical protein
MIKPDQFYLRWRGRVTGPFSWPEVERKLDAHEIGLLHDLQQNNNWTTLGEFIAQRGDAVRINAALPVAAPLSGADLRSGPGQAPPIIGSVSTRRPPDRRIFVALALLVGFIGLHDFYAHHWIRGAVLLIAAIICWRLDWGIIWPWLVAIAEIIWTKFDGKGRRMPWKRKS